MKADYMRKEAKHGFLIGLGLVGKLALFLLLPTLAFAQTTSQRNPCYGTSATTSNCISVTPNTPLPMSIYNNGVPASVSLDGSLSVATPASPQFTDLFSSTLDTTINWTVNNSGGTAATSNGSLVVSGTTTASQWGGLATKQSWTPAGPSAQVYGVSVAYNALSVSNSVRIHGIYTSPGSPTLAAPITDGYVFRLDASGQLFAEIYASGTASFSSNITSVAQCTPTAGIPNLYYFIFRTNLTQFGCGQNPLAAIAFVNPINQTLPISVYSVAGLSNPASAATMTLTGISLSSYSPASVKSAGQSATINDSSLVVQLSPNSASVVSHASTTALTNSLSVKASSGNLLGYNCTSITGGSSGFCIAYNGSSTPGTGALTGANVLDFCFYDTSARGCSLSRIPVSVLYSSGIQILLTSAASPYTYTTGVNTAAMSADYQ